MDNYFLVKNDFINAIDDDYFNLAFIRKQRFNFTSEPGITYYYRIFEVDITGIDFPVIAISCVCPSAYLSMKANTLSIVCSASNYDGVANSVSNLNNSSKYLDVFVFGRLPRSSIPEHGIGVVCLDASSKVVYYSGAEYLKPIKMFIDPNTYRPMFNSNYNTQVEYLPIGKSYACIPLNRVNTVYSEWTPEGQDVIAMSSVCAIEGNTITYTSNRVQVAQDISAVYNGYCRHMYMLIDVSNY
ncbi:hypothetical protein ABTB16_07890 [Acinetobacter baumannii]|uniref:hypothetical protein n=1 Tax=Acinetobacter baumannii TaxID=470 RepID=UPI003A4E3C9E